mgnify:CR=1 FL=1
MYEDRAATLEAMGLGLDAAAAVQPLHLRITQEEFGTLNKGHRSALSFTYGCLLGCLGQIESSGYLTGVGSAYSGANEGRKLCEKALGSSTCGVAASIYRERLAVFKAIRRAVNDAKGGA